MSERLLVWPVSVGRPAQPQRFREALAAGRYAYYRAERHPLHYFLPAETARRFRPLSRRRFKTALPALVELRRRNPCVRLRFTFDGWYVRLGTWAAPSTNSFGAANSPKLHSSQFPISSRGTAHRRSEAKCARKGKDYQQTEASQRPLDFGGPACPTTTRFVRFG